jgi:type I restriction enzyme S subunit
MEIATMNIKEIRESLILKPNYHLNFGKLRISKVIKSGVNCDSLGVLTKSIYTGGIFKRVFVENINNGIPYISGQHLLDSNPLDTAKLISKKYTPRQNDMVLRENQILVSCAGAVGNIRLITKDLDGVIGSQDIIRVIADESKSPVGFIYAYLSSPTAYNYIQSFIYGSVVPRIDPTTLSKLPIPFFHENKQNDIHNLIIQAAELRVNGNKILGLLRKEFEKLIEQELSNSLVDYKKYSSVSIKNIRQFEQRFDAPYNCDLGRKIYELIIANEYLSLSAISEVFLPILFGKKQLKGTPLNGNALFKSSSMMQLTPETDFWLSPKKNAMYSRLQVKAGWVLVSRTGTVGNVVRITERLNNIFIDDHMVRIIPKEDYSGLIYIYLSTLYGQELIKFQKYGSVQDVINSEYIGRIPIPKCLTEKLFLKRVQKSVEGAHKMIDRANLLEEEAIRLIETEIEQWQQ